MALYHYCRLPGFFEIINSSSLWLSNAYSLNDYTEIHWANRSVESVIPYLTTLLDDRSFFEIFSAQFPKFNPDPYIAAFAYNKDSLGLWQGYGDSGFGLAIGFDEEFLESFAQEPSAEAAENHQVPFPEFLCGSVTYDEGHHAGSVDTVLKQKMVDAAAFPLDDVIDAAMKSVYEVRKLSYFLKNSSFSDEHEWRFVYIPDYMNGEKTTGTNATLGKVKYRISGNNIVPYHELTLPHREKTITDVVLGPKTKIDERFLKMFLHDHGHQHVTINRSQVPLR